jgi:hypothetical protein
MGCILKEDGVIATYIENKIRVTNWRYIIPTENGITVCISNNVFFIHDITLDDFIEIASKNIKKSYKFKYKNHTLICPNCNGIGAVDWVRKAAKEPPDHNGKFYGLYKDTPPYIRGATVQKIIPWDGDIIYISGPPKRLGEEYCVDCHGCGVLLQPAIKSIEVVTNFGKS